jgi:hypothetical protein
MEELRLPLDATGFSRRECPRCRAHFKVRWTERESTILAAALARRVAHAGPAPDPGGPRFCPYCAAEAPAEEFYTQASKERVDAEARRVDAEVRWHRLHLPAEWGAPGPRASAPPPVLSIDPPPWAALEAADDLLRIQLPCCGEEQKVTDAWLGPIRCHLCGTAHLRAGPRDIGLEMALLRQWAGER